MCFPLLLCRSNRKAVSRWTLRPPGGREAVACLVHHAFYRFFQGQRFLLHSKCLHSAISYHCSYCRMPPYTSLPNRIRAGMGIGMNGIPHMLRGVERAITTASADQLYQRHRWEITRAICPHVALQRLQPLRDTVRFYAFLQMLAGTIVLPGPSLSKSRSSRPTETSQNVAITP